MEKMILQKFIAQSGFSSRRKAEEAIREGKVKVNEKPAELGMRVGMDDEVYVGKKKIELKRGKLYYALNKPVGYTCTNAKFKGERNVFELMKKTSPQPSPYKGEGERLFIVGRLDKDSRGLIILTDDGMWAESISHPKYEHEKEYLIELENRLNKSMVYDIQRRFISGVDIKEEENVSVKDISYIGRGKFKLILTQGKKRQIRRMFKALGFEVKDLCRVRIGNIRLGGLKEGMWKKIKV